MIKFKVHISQLIAKIRLKKWSLNQIIHYLTGHNQIWHHFCIKKLKYLNELQNRNFSVLWLKWIQTMEMKENKKFFHGTYSNLTPHLFQRKILKYFNDFQNRNLSVLWLKLTQTMEMKENQIFFHETHSNLTLLFIGQKILKYVNGFCSCHLLISLQKWTQTSKVMGHVQQERGHV